MVPGFIIQGGGFDPDMNAKPTKGRIKNEARNGLSNTSGKVAMSRKGGVSNSDAAQFFINLADNDYLDPGRDVGYCVFGTVTNGMDIVDQISQLSTTKVFVMADIPKETVLISSVSVIDTELLTWATLVLGGRWAKRCLPMVRGVFGVRAMQVLYRTMIR